MMEKLYHSVDAATSTGKMVIHLRRFEIIHQGKTMSPKRPTYSIVIAGIKRDLTLFEVKKGVSIAILNILGDTELVQACAKALHQKLNTIKYDVLLTAETKSVPLAHALALAANKPYVILRKSYKPYMGKTITAETVSITTGKPQMLFLDEKDRDLMKGKNVVIFDDVISTGSTLEGMRSVVKQARGKVVAEAAILAEGDEGCWPNVISLGHLPIFESRKGSTH
jgi:adenine phosphoribosyltransferase